MSDEVNSKLTKVEKALLTDKEASVYALMKTGMINKHIIRELGITSKTLYTRKSRIKSKLFSIEPTGSDCYDHRDSIIDMLQAQNQVLRKRDNASTKVATVSKQVLDLFTSEIGSYKAPKTPRIPKVKGDSSENQLILSIADFHVGETVSSTSTLGIDEYSLEIAQRRAKTFTAKIIDKIRKMRDMNFTKINFFSLGDMVTGIIHEELIINGAPITKQALAASEIIGEVLLQVYKEIPNIEVTSIVGNHGRMSKKPSYKDAWNNFDWLVAKFVEVRFANYRNITFTTPEADMAIVDIMGFQNLLTHGDCYNGNTKIPYANLEKGANEIFDMIRASSGVNIDNLFMGHWHRFGVGSTQRGHIIMVGSLKGGDEYVAKKLRKSSRPSQALSVINSKDNIIMNWEIRCD